MSQVHLESARNMYDEADMKTSVKGHGGELACFSCGQKGHKSTDCPVAGRKASGSMESLRVSLLKVMAKVRQLYATTAR